MSLADIRPALRSFLLADGAVSALVGTRIWPMRMPQANRLAGVVYHRISEQVDHTMDGPSGLAEQRIQIDAWAPSADAAAVLADAVKERLDGFRGPMTFGGDSPPDEVNVQGVFLDNGRDDYDPAVDLYRVSRDYLISFEER